MKTLRVSETAQQTADACLDLAQHLEALAKNLRRDAKHYRAGELLTGYNVPNGASAEYQACAEVMHPAARAIDTIAGLQYRVQEHIDRNIASLKGGTR